MSQTAAHSLIRRSATLRAQHLRPSAQALGGVVPSSFYGTFHGSVSTRRRSKEEFMREFQDNAALRNSMTYSLSFASDELAFKMFEKHNMLTERMKAQLDYAQDQLLRRDMDRDSVSTGATRSALDAAPLPSNWMQLNLPQNENRAIVVTDASAPFGIVHVNKTWEGLCGFEKDECKGQSLGSLLQGPDTDKGSLSAMMARLLQGDQCNDVGVVVTNYTKTGRRFRNHLRVGPIYEGGSNVPSHFVGVLQEIHDGM